MTYNKLKVTSMIALVVVLLTVPTSNEKFMPRWGRNCVQKG